MEGVNNIDIFATKGLEYVLVIGFLVVLIFFWKYLHATGKMQNQTSTVSNENKGWFTIAKGYFYHKGHSWVLQENGNIVKVGIDDFIRLLIGKPTEISLPKIGNKIAQGENGWVIKTESKEINVLSPIEGEVIEVNKDVIESPEKLSNETYSENWLMKIKPSNLKSNLSHLLSDQLALKNSEITLEKLKEKMSSLVTTSDELGVVMQDGGIPVDGFIKCFPKEEWGNVIEEFLLTK